MVQSIKLLEGETEVKNKGNRKQENESDSKVDHEKKEEQKSSQEKGELGPLVTPITHCFRIPQY